MRAAHEIYILFGDKLQGCTVFPVEARPGHPDAQDQARPSKKGEWKRGRSRRGDTGLLISTPSNLTLDDSHGTVSCSGTRRWEGYIYSLACSERVQGNVGVPTPRYDQIGGSSRTVYMASPAPLGRTTPAKHQVQAPRPGGCREPATFLWWPFDSTPVCDLAEVPFRWNERGIVM